uniref:DUF7796 domain-containing protein n=1 Tax=Desulfatirhabdium butyrativorans TaxID=340467 RepID=A0A7C4VS56_9BACT
MKPFVYLIQAAQDMPYPELPDEDNDIILLTWKAPSDVPGSLFLPGSSWNEGRNALLAEARKRVEAGRADYLYYIFLDEDVQIKEDTELAARLHVPLTGNPFRTFEAWLLDWEPAVGYTRYSWQYTEADSLVNLGHNFDALMNAFHREALPLLLPYETGFDAESWLYSQLIVAHLCTLFYPEHRLQCNLVLTKNKTRRTYVQKKRCWHIPTTYLCTALSSDLRSRLPKDHPNRSEPVVGIPRKKEESYRLDEALRQQIDWDHPLFRYREEGRRCGTHTGAGSRRGLHRRVALLISGSLELLDRTADNLRTMLIERLPACDVFIFAPDDAGSRNVGLLAPVRWRIEPDMPISEGCLRNGINCRLKTGVQRYLQQLNGLKQCWRLFNAWRSETGTVYDVVIRCRPDIRFVRPVDGMERIDLRYVHVPDFHGFDGVNDRFAVGRPEDMAWYMNKLDEFESYVTDWHAAGCNAQPVSAEMFTAGQLRRHGIRIRQAPFRFNRVRAHGEKRDVAGDG